MFLQKCFAQPFSTYILALQFFGAKYIDQKFVHKMLIELTPDVNSINIFLETFS